MTLLLISHPNQRNGIINPLTLLAPNVELIVSVHFEIGEPYIGTTGLTRLGDGTILVGLMGPHHGFVLLSPNFEILKIVKYPQIKEPHSMIPGIRQNSALVCSSGNDSIWDIDLINEPILFYKFEKTSPITLDFHHLNSLTQDVYGRIFFTHFDEKIKPEASWWSNTDGKIVDLHSNYSITSGLFHPHSLTIFPSGFLVCESSARKVHRITSDGDIVQTIELPGYTRGLQWDGSNIFVGLSVWRQVSRSTGLDNLNVKSSPRVANVAVLTNDLELVELIELPNAPEEIYDIICVGGR